MSLVDRNNPQSKGYASGSLAWNFNPTTPSSHQYESSMWVHLFQAPSEFSFDEALLLCRHDGDGDWVTWVPNYGELLLNESQFVPLS